MRIDREAFLLAVSALAGCERADTTEQARTPRFEPAAQAEAQQFPASSMLTREAYEPPAPPEPVAPRRPLSAAKRWFFGLSMEDRSNVSSLCEEQHAHPCAAFFAELRGLKYEDPADRYLVGMSSQQRQQANSYCTETGPSVAPTCETPLVASFDNQPVEFAAPGRDTFAFVPGTPMATDWPTAATPWIAIDLDGDGAITSGAELLGSSTQLAGGTTARNGYEALAALDANGDGVVDARDPAFARLVLWPTATAIAAARPTSSAHSRASSPRSRSPTRSTRAATPAATAKASAAPSAGATPPAPSTKAR